MASGRLGTTRRSSRIVMHDDVEVLDSAGSASTGEPAEVSTGGQPWLSRVIGYYQRYSAASRPRCRYVPTCSEYALEAIESHGSTKGAWLGIRRICRCHPLGSHGYDPVPEKAER